MILRERPTARVYRTERGILKVSPRAALEARVYREVLPRTGLPCLRLLDEGEGWLLVEEARGEPYGERHRQAGARWMAALHALPRPAGLPDLETDLEPALRVLRLASEHPGLDRGVVRRLQEAAETLPAVRLPHAIVHGDFWPCNVRVREGQVLAFDWEQAAWGCPLRDLALVDLALYAELRGLPLDADAHRAARTLHVLQALPGEEPVVRSELVGRLGRKLRAYAEALDS